MLSQYGSQSASTIAARWRARLRACSSGSSGVSRTSGPNSGWVASRSRSTTWMSS